MVIDPTPVIAAVIIGVFGLIGVYFQHRTTRRVEQMHDALKTNHGKRPGEYLELVGELDEKVDRLERAVGVVAATVADHTVADESNFAQLRTNQEHMAVSLGETAQAAINAVNAAVRANVAAKANHDDVMAELALVKKKPHDH
jgi:hypothetical protein